MQETSFFACSESIAAMCSEPDAWHVKQRALMSFAEAFSKRKSFEVSVGSAMWLAAAPWHASHPCLEGPPRVSSVVFQCGLFSQLEYSSAWQTLQGSDPT